MKRRSFLWLLLLAGCGGDDPLTQTVVTVNVDPALLGMSPEIEVMIRSGGQLRNEDRRCLGDGDGCLGVPFQLVLAPGNGSVRRPWELRLSLIAAENVLVNRRLLGTHLAGQTRRVAIQLEASCVGQTCSEVETCAAGACVSPCLDPPCGELVADAQGAGGQQNKDKNRGT
ncbi:MAG: hypothetical protein AAGF12_05715, partial [Myxococcota bacterium]